MLFRAFFCLALAGWIGVSPLGAKTAAPGLQTVEIIVAPTNRVSGPEIFLGDIAQIHAPPFIKEVLVKIGLGNAPRPGRIKQLTQNRILSIIRSRRGLPPDMVIQVPEIVYVRQESQEIDPQAVRDQVDLFLAERFKGKEHELAHLNLPAPGPLPLGTLGFFVTSRSDVDKHGNLTVFMDILVNGNRQESLRMTGKVAVHEDILCAAQNMAKGEPVFEKDLLPVRKNIFTLPEDVVRTLREGQILTTNVQKESPIRSSWLKESPLIHKGDIITLVARRHNLVIVTAGISKEDGYAREIIRVENIGSGKIVQGQVLEKSTVEVIY